MGELPSIQLLEATHTFPGPYMFKVIGRVENGFVARVVAAVRDELEDQFDPPFKVREAQGGCRQCTRSWRSTVASATWRAWCCCCRGLT
jgi:hypothetical protein